jgi:hypothetical protein
MPRPEDGTRIAPTEAKSAIIEATAAVALWSTTSISAARGRQALNDASVFRSSAGRPIVGITTDALRVWAWGSPRSIDRLSLSPAGEGWECRTLKL